MPAPTGITPAMLARTPAAVRERLESVQRCYDALLQAHRELADSMHNVPGHKSDTAFHLHGIGEKGERNVGHLPDGTVVAFSLAPTEYDDKHGLGDYGIIEVRVVRNHGSRPRLQIMGSPSGLVLRPNVTNVVNIELEDDYHETMVARTKKRGVVFPPPCDAVFKDGRVCTEPKGHTGPHDDKVVIHNRKRAR